MEELVSVIESSLKKGMPFTDVLNSVLTVTIGTLPAALAVETMLEATQSAAWLNGTKFEYSIVPTQVDHNAVH